MDETMQGVSGPVSPLTQSSVRQRNLWRVLQNIRETGITSRVRVAHETGLTATTVHRLTDDLRRHGLITRVPAPARSAIGRPPTLFRFNGRTGHVVGIDIGNETTRAILADLDGLVLARTALPTASIEGNLPLAIGDLVSDLQRESALQHKALVAIGVGVAAVIAPEGVIVRASLHHLWEGLQLGLQLRRSFESEVLVSQDDHLAALAELEFGACLGLRDALVVNVGKGVGAGIVVDGAVYRGSSGAAGRVGWIPGMAGASSGDPETMAPLASLLTADGLIADYQARGGREAVASARDVFLADATGDRAATGAVDMFADRLGWLIGTAAAILDPQRVVVGGGISGSFERLSPRIAARVADIVALPPPIVASTLGTDAVAIGAIASATRMANTWLMARMKS